MSLTAAKVEKYTPCLLALAAPASYFYAWHGMSHGPSADSLNKVAEVIVGLSGIIVGFLATATALLYALPDRNAVQFLKETHAIDMLRGYMLTDVFIGLATAVTAIVLVLIGPNTKLFVMRVVVGWWLYLPMLSILGFGRSMFVLSSFLRVVDRSAPNESEK
jgi:hypothetical protein